MKELVGKTIQKCLIDKDAQHFIRFITDDGEITYYAEGDCCSESWFYHVLGVNALVGHKVTECQQVDMGEINDDKNRQEYDSLYKVTLKTLVGYCDIEFRNSSNGYYGGSLYFVPSDRKARYYGEYPDDVNWLEVTEDYTA